MTIAYLCIVIAIFIPLFCVGYAKWSGKGYNNRQPREFAQQLEGKAKRAYNAQINSYEIFAPFAVGVLVAHQLHAPQPTIDLLAVIFLTARIFYAAFYIYDHHLLRSLAWFAGLLTTVTLYFIGA